MVNNEALLCLDVIVRPMDEFQYKGSPSVHLHAAILNLVKDNEANTEAHEANQRRLFAIGPLLDVDGAPLCDGDNCTPKSLFQFKIGSALNGFNQNLRTVLQPGLQIRLQRKVWEIIAVQAVDRLDGLRPMDLYRNAMIQSSTTLRLLTPTFFRANAIEWSLVPEPGIIFRGLAQCWEALSGDNIPPLTISSASIYEKVNRTVRLGEMEVVTVEHEGRGEQRGIIGVLKLEFTGPEINRQLIREFNMLLSLCPYVGIGAKTAFGFGQAMIMGEE